MWFQFVNDVSNQYQMKAKWKGGQPAPIVSAN